MYKAPRYHFTRAAGNAFATRFYLYKGEWSKVIQYANKVIPTPASFINETFGDLEDNNGNVIETNVLLSRNISATDKATIYAGDNFSPWTTYYYEVTGGSSAIRLHNNSSNNHSNLLLTEMTTRIPRYVQNWRYGTTSSETESTVSAANVTGGVWAFRTYYDTATRTHYYVPKFYEHFVKASINATTGSITTMYPYLRNEEVLLSRAEANAMLGNYDEAIDDLNIYCRQRIFASSSNRIYSETGHVVNKQKLINFYGEGVSDMENNYMNVYDAYGASTWPLLQKCIIQCILDFRRNEFMWEGLRYWDMARYKIPIKHTTFDNQTRTLYPGDDRWVIEIPESAALSGIELNPRDNILDAPW